jgi:hypothetical protein
MVAREIKEKKEKETITTTLPHLDKRVSMLGKRYSIMGKYGSYLGKRVSNVGKQVSDLGKRIWVSVILDPLTLRSEIVFID